MKPPSVEAWSDEDERGVFVRLLRVKERLLLCNPAFQHDAEMLQGELGVPDDSKTSDFTAARAFAAKWNIPFRAQHDPWFLTEAPFACNPVIRHERLAVQRQTQILPPFLQVVVDVRFRDDQIVREVVEHVRAVREEGDLAWQESMRQWRRDAAKWEGHLDVYERRQKQMTFHKICDDLEYQGDEGNLRRKAKETKAAVESRFYLQILPYLNADVFQEIQQATLGHGWSKHWKAPGYAEARPGKPTPPDKTRRRS